MTASWQPASCARMKDVRRHFWKKSPRLTPCSRSTANWIVFKNTDDAIIKAAFKFNFWRQSLEWLGVCPQLWEQDFEYFFSSGTAETRFFCPIPGCFLSVWTWSFCRITGWFADLLRSKLSNVVPGMRLPRLAHIFGIMNSSVIFIAESVDTYWISLICLSVFSTLGFSPGNETILLLHFAYIVGFFATTILTSIDRLLPPCQIQQQAASE